MRKTKLQDCLEKYKIERENFINFESSLQKYLKYILRVVWLNQQIRNPNLYIINSFNDFVITITLSLYNRIK